MSLNPRVVLAVAYLVAFFVPAIPVLAALFAPPPPVREASGGLAVLDALIDVAAGAGRARLVLLCSICAVVLAVLATLLAWWLARRGAATGAMPIGGWGLWAPVFVAMAGLLIGVNLGDALLKTS